jgi:LysM repeat protein
MARSTIALLVIGVSLLAAACGGDDSEEATPTATVVSSAVATATPFATLPSTTILDGGGVSGEATPIPEVTYTVVAGDSLGLIAEEFGTTVEAIQTLNGLTGTNIFVGQELLIPGENGEAATPQPTPSTPGGTTLYVVQPGDSGFGIALEFDITLEQLAAANGMSVDQLGALFVGQELLIPTP